MMNAVATVILGFMGIFLLGFGVSDLAQGAPAEPGPTTAKPGDRADSHSFGNPEQVSVYQVVLDLTVDFDQRVLKGTAILDFNRQPGCPADAPLVLDTNGLSIEAVGLRKMDPIPKSFTPTGFQLGPADPIMGSRLTIDLNPTASQVRIAYRTVPSAGALQWLEPSLTAGKVKPFLFTQSEAIHARSWIPLQDSPGVRVTYVATIRVPRGLTAVMAAEARNSPADTSQGVFNYVMAQPIPSYLIALAVGDLAFQPLGDRTGVWAEPGVVKAAAYEFADVEKMVESAEKQFGRYRWGRYDILVLPPSFPFGGMENPRLTFATPTVLAGDRSLVSLIAHELAHSWSGNLVTNATWRDFWLNEGFTTYIERRIVEDIYGRDRADMEAVLGLAELRQQLSQLPEKDQVLHIDLNGRDPDDGMTQIPYEKGALFLRTLEHTFGRARFDGFLQAYFDEHVFKSITTADFENFLRDRLFRHDPPSAQSIDLTAWLERPGLPKVYAEPKSGRLAAIDQMAKSWSNGSVATGQIRAGEWSTQEWLRFLQALPEKLTLERLADLDQTFGLTDRGNSEIAHQWLLMAIRNHYKPAGPRLESYLTTIGRRKLVLPLYRALIATPDGRKRAEAIYAKARQGYHPITAESINRLFKETK
jgi:leukotriene-A4 hydrolase